MRPGDGRRAPLVPATVREDILIIGVRVVGQYALCFAFNDGHGTGIYPYDALLELCPCDECAAKREAGEAGANGR